MATEASNSAIASDNQSLAANDWDELLMYIQGGQVIPVVGPELVTVPAEDGAACPLSRWLAPRLARQLNLDDPDSYTELNKVACAYLLSPGSERKRIYNSIRVILRGTQFEPGPALIQLAEISDFDLFLTTTFDPLLGMAMERARPAFARSRDVMAFDTKPSTPFPDPLPGSLVYHMLGRLETFPDFAVWEEDYMEYLCHFIEQSREPALDGLLRQLRSRHLLILGAPFSDWVVRLFLRAARGRRLSDPREHGTGEYLADRPANLGEPTMFFFNQLAKDTRVISGDPSEFVAELSLRWHQDNASAAADRDFLERLAEDLPRGSIFISYSRDDSEAAARLASALHSANIPVWLDKGAIQVGDYYPRKTEFAVRDGCSFFIALISAATETDKTRFVHREREWAATRHQEGYQFYFPVIIDDTPNENVRLEPACFEKVHRECMPGGTPSEAFLQRLRSMIELWRAGGRPRSD